MGIYKWAGTCQNHGNQWHAQGTESQCPGWTPCNLWVLPGRGHIKLERYKHYAQCCFVYYDGNVQRRAGGDATRDDSNVHLKKFRNCRRLLTEEAKARLS